jgi:dTDP-4-amino-4,6-dideoxygalactose transaminase
MKVPQAQPVMTEEMIQAAATALRNERLTLGESVNKFEEAFARMCGTKHAVALSSGTAALQLALQAADVKCGDKVLTSAMSFVATSNSFVAPAGSTPCRKSTISICEFPILPGSTPRKS